MGDVAVVYALLMVRNRGISEWRGMHDGEGDGGIGTEEMERGVGYIHA